MLGISSSTAPVIRSQFRELLKLMSSHLEYYPFLLGWNISLADFAWFGSFYAHLSRDPVPSFIIKTEAPLVFDWVERVQGLARWAGQSVDRWDTRSKMWLPTYGTTRTEQLAPKQENVPESSSKIAGLLLRDYVHVLYGTLNRCLEYIKTRAASHSSNRVPLPRVLGSHDFTLHTATPDEPTSTTGERLVYTHAVWMFDRLISRTYTSPEQIQASNAWLLSLDSEGVILNTWIECAALWRQGGWRIERNENKLVAITEKQSTSSHL